MQLVRGPVARVTRSIDRPGAADNPGYDSGVQRHGRSLPSRMFTRYLVDRMGRREGATVLRQLEAAL
jgi:hypothetical protein